MHIKFSMKSKKNNFMVYKILIFTAIMYYEFNNNLLVTMHVKIQLREI